MLVAPTQARLQEILNYDPETGVFTWRSRSERNATWNARYAGQIAGTISAGGYRQIRIDGPLYYAHKLAWLFVYGEWVEGILDHRDRDRDNHAIENLRPATPSQNRANSAVRRNNTSGFTGVVRRPDRPVWVARMRLDGKERHIGSFSDKQEAIRARRAAEEEAFGEFAPSSGMNTGVYPRASGWRK